MTPPNYGKIRQAKGKRGSQQHDGETNRNRIIKQLKNKNGNGREGHEGVLLGGEEWRKGAGRIKNESKAEAG